MKFKAPLQEGLFLKRYKRFFADIQMGDQVITAHVANTGSLKTCSEPGSPCLFSTHDDPNRKLKFSLEMIKAPSGSWVGINTSLPNLLVKEALLNKLLPHWEKWEEVKPEFKLNKETRLDFCLRNPGSEKCHFIEVKNVTMVREKRAEFPDAVTERGQKHLREMMSLIESGHSAELVYVVQREDAEVFSPADDIDPEYGRLLREAHQKGLMMTPLVAELSPHEIQLTGKTLTVRL